MSLILLLSCRKSPPTRLKTSRRKLGRIGFCRKYATAQHPYIEVSPGVHGPSVVELYGTAVLPDALH